MSDLISRTEAIKEIKKLAEKYNNKQTTDYSQFYVGEEDGCYSAIYILEEMKPAEPRTGKWIPYDRYDELAPERLRQYKCSVCGEKQRSVLTGGRLIGGYGAEAIGSTFENDFEKFFSPYCPFCGAKMEMGVDPNNCRKCELANECDLHICIKAVRKRMSERSNERSKRCKGCEYARDLHAQDGWHFHGCFHKPYNGKWIAEIENCPKERSKE